MNSSEHLIGFWKTDQRGPEAAAEDGDVSIEFKSDGSAVYSIYYPDKVQKVLLSYKVEGDEIVTDQPSRPSVQRTKYAIEPDGSLILWFNGIKGRFLKR